MASIKLLTDEKEVKRNPQRIADKKVASINTNEFFFYSNYPEQITINDTADKGYYLNKVENIKGYGQVYCWHQNVSKKTLNHCLLIYNPNNFQVKIDVPNCGLTAAYGEPPDSTAWKNYCVGPKGQGVTVPAGGYANMFLRSISNNNVVGIVARFNITKTDGSAIPGTGVTIFEMAYETNSGGAQKPAPANHSDDATRTRGRGAGFYATMTAPTIRLTSSNGTQGVSFWIGSSDDNFNGTDCSVITPVGGALSGRLPGAFGQQLKITIPIQNGYSQTRNFRVCIGSRGGKCCPFVYFNNQVSTFTQLVEYDYYRDMLEVEIPANSQANVEFTTVIPAATAAPYSICVRAV